MAPALLLLKGLGAGALAVGWLLWLVWSLSAAYLVVLTIGAVSHTRKARRAVSLTHKAQRGAGGPSRKIGVLIPAHNEELLLGGVLDRLHTLDYPQDRFRLFVIADNCTDETARVGREHGAEVLERTDADLRGKGYALEWALERLLPDARGFDAFLILDADSYLSENFLRVMDSRLAAGEDAIQGLYQVENVGESWRTKLMTCALALAHYVKPMGRMEFGLSDGLKGNGMCFSREVLARIPWSGESITEDIEYTLRLVQAGVRIVFAPEAVVRAQMPTNSRQATTQRKRWEGGRYALLRQSLGLLGRALRSGRPMVADRAVELIIPPFVELFALPAVGLIGGVVWVIANPMSFGAVLWMTAWAAVMLAGLCYLVAGLIIARVPWSVASALMFAPVYAVWKLGVYGTMLLRRGPSGWVRTERHERAG